MKKKAATADYVLTFHYPNGRIYNYSTYATRALAQADLKRWSKAGFPKGSKIYIVKYTYLRGGMVRPTTLKRIVFK